MRADGLEWGEGYRPLGRQALAEDLQGRMAEAVDDWLDSLDGSAMRDRRNGSYSRHLLTELGDIELSVPRHPGASARRPCSEATPGVRPRSTVPSWPASCSGFLTDLHRRGLTGDGLEMILCQSLPLRRRGRPGPDRRAPHRLPGYPAAALLGAQDQKRPRQAP